MLNFVTKKEKKENFSFEFSLVPKHEVPSQSRARQISDRPRSPMRFTPHSADVSWPDSLYRKVASK